MKTTWKFWLVASLVCLGILVILDARIKATASTNQKAMTFDVSEPVTPVLSIAVRDLLPVEEPYLAREVNPIQWLGDGVGESGAPIGLDPLAAMGVNGGTAPDPLVTFEGVPSISGVTPPDTNGDVGPNHYVQMTNFHFQIWDKGDPDNGIPPSVVQSATSLSSLFSPIGGSCATNQGDPVVLYDDMADRWLLSQFVFASGGPMCFAISTTPDPTGPYFLYSIPTPPGDLPDYPKLGVWPDAYYMGTNSGFPNAYYAQAFDRVAMLAGLPATRQSFGDLANLMMPADVDGQEPPPVGDPGLFYTYYHPNGGGHPAGVARLAIYEFDVDWITPGNSTYTLAAELPVAPFNYTVCGFFAGGCVPQPGTGQLLDDLSWWPMFRFQYRNFDSFEAMVGNFTVDLDNTNKAAIRWFEVRKVGGVYTLYQEGTYAPDASHRWMGSIAMDGSGHIALGYSVSDPVSSIEPSIRYATRLNNDPLGTLSTEAEMWTGIGVQTSIHRWGDYSALTVDPVDNCTFWYTTEYHDVTDSGFGWNTRIGVFRIPECTGGLGPDFDVEVSPDNLDVCILSDGSTDVTLEWLEGYSLPVTLSALGVPAGYSTSFNPNPIVSPTLTSELTFISTGAATAGSYPVDIVGVGTPTPTHTATLTLDLFDPISSGPVLLTPTDGATGVSPAPTFTWDSVFGATSYGLDIATDAGFNNIVYSTTGITDTTHTLTVALDELTLYYWRVNANNVCGDGAYPTPFSFTTKEVPAILVVDDDDNSPDSLLTYTSALDILGWDYDIWNTNNSDDEPSATDLAPYSAVIWFTGDESGGAAGPGAASETALGSWLDNTQGCFFLSSQDYFFDRGLTPFMSSYLGAATITENNGDFGEVIGQGTVFSGLGSPFISYPPQMTDRADSISADGTAEVGIIGTNGKGAGVNKDSGYQTAFWVFPLEAIHGEQNERNALDAFLTWCDIADSNGTLSGTVTAAGSGEPISGATVSVSGPAMNGTTTDGNGDYSLEVPNGTYTVTVAASGYVTETLAGVEIVTGTTTTQDFALDLITLGVELDPDQEGIASAGSTLTHTLHITNTGNVADTFDLTFSGNVWTTTLPDNNLTLAAGDSTTFIVVVTIPSGAAEGDEDAVTVTATSQTDGSVSASTTLTTTVGIPGYFIFLPLIMR